MPNFRLKNLHWLWLAGLVLALDYSSKWLAVKNMVLWQPTPIFPGFNLTLAYNTGAAFSFLSQSGGWQMVLFISIAITVCIGLLVWLLTLPAKNCLDAMAISCIMGGAIGNLIDRIFRGYVIDFIDVYFKQYHWPVFNIADSAIFIGVCLLLISLTRQQKRNQS